MDKKTAFHLAVLSIATLLMFFWISNETLNTFSLQLSAMLLITLILSRHYMKLPSFKLAESTISTMCVILLTTYTGGLMSPFFFLNVFLLFELSLLLEPVIPLFLSAMLGIFYFFSHQTGSPPYSFFALLSFPLMTPLAYLFGQTYLKVSNQKLEIQNLTKQLEEYKEDIPEHEKKDRS
jgi:hypothetical protein